MTSMLELHKVCMGQNIFSNIIKIILSRLGFKFNLKMPSENTFNKTCCEEWMYICGENNENNFKVIFQC